MRKSFIAAAFACAASGAAFAKEPVKMSEKQMDQVTAGAPLIVVRDVLDVGNVQVAIPVTAGVQAAVAILGAAGNAGQVVAAPGRIGQRN